VAPRAQRSGLYARGADRDPAALEDRAGKSWALQRHPPRTARNNLPCEGGAGLAGGCSHPRWAGLPRARPTWAATATCLALQGCLALLLGPRHLPPPTRVERARLADSWWPPARLWLPRLTRCGSRPAEPAPARANAQPVGETRLGGAQRAPGLAAGASGRSWPWYRIRDTRGKIQ